MKKMYLPLLMGTLLFASCQSPKAAENFDIEAAKKEISEIHTTFETAVAKGDSVAWASIFAPDAKRMAPNMSSIQGTKDITANFNAIIKSNTIGSVKLTMVELWGNKDYVTEEGNFEIYAKDGSVLDKGKYVDLFKNIDGHYKMFREAWNSDLPLPAATK